MIHFIHFSKNRREEEKREGILFFFVSYFLYLSCGRKGVSKEERKGGRKNSCFLLSPFLLLFLKEEEMKEKKRKTFGYSSSAFPLSFLKRRRKGIEEENSTFSSLLFPNRMEKEKEGEREWLRNFKKVDLTMWISCS